MSEGHGEKVFDPTPHRLAEARRKGDIPRSADVTAAATYLALLAVVGTVGAYAVAQAASVLLIFVAQPDRLSGRILGPGGPKLSGAILPRRWWRWRRCSWCRSPPCWPACSPSRP